MPRLLSSLLLLVGTYQIGSAQTLPSYLIDTFPAANATGVGTNIRILVRARINLDKPPFASSGYYTLKDPAGTAVSFANSYDCCLSGLALIPKAPLAANTKYTLTINPGQGIDTYSFSFTTGSGPDTTAPRLLGVDPPSGTTDVGIAGPFRFRFDRRITQTAISGDAVKITQFPAYSVFGYLSLDDDGSTVLVRPSVNQAFPAAYDISVDPTKFLDAFGNAGEGQPLTVHYTTFAATNTSPARLTGTLPFDGESGVVTNVVPRLVFTKRIDSASVSKGIELRGDAKETFTISAISDSSESLGSAFSLTPTRLLAANRTYTITISSELRDTTGFGAEPQTIRFTTGAGPDVVAPQVIATAPNGSVYAPPNPTILIRTNKPVSPLSAERLSALGLQENNTNAVAPARATLSSDGTLLTITPAQPLPRGYYRVRTDEIIDLSGQLFYSDSSGPQVSFTTQGAEDHQPPMVVAVNPPPDSDSVPLSPAIQIQFSEPCATCAFPGAITVTANGQPVKYSFSYSNSPTTYILNTGALSAATTYRVALQGIQDLAGNPMPDYSFQFTTAASAITFQPLNLVESSIANGATGVDRAGPFVMRFDGILNPVSAANSTTIQGAGAITYPVIAASSGNTLTITPVLPLPANTSLQLYCNINGLLGGGKSIALSFTTAGPTDSIRPVVSSISPSDGSEVPYNGTFVLTFSKPIDQASLSRGAIAIYSNGTSSSPIPSRSEDNRSISFPAPSGPPTAFSVIASSTIRDLEGNALEPFEAHYTRAPAVNLLAGVQEIRPSPASRGVAADTTITWFLDRAPDLASVRANLIVLANSAPHPGSFDLSADGRILRFLPSRPFPAGASVTIYQRSPGVLSSNTGMGFTVAEQPDNTLRFVRASFGVGQAIDSVFEIEFTQDPPLGQTVTALTISQGHGDVTPVPYQESIPRPHVLRLTTIGPRVPGYYAAALSGKVIGNINAPRYISGTVQAGSLPGQPTVAAFGPTRDATGVPINTSVRILFGAALNQLTVTPSSAVLSAGGKTLPVERVYSAITDRALVLRPLDPLPAGTRIDVRLSGIEDAAGRVIPETSWSFTTGSALDYTPPVLLATSLPRPIDGWLQVAANEAIQFSFDEPIDPTVTFDLSYGSGIVNNTARITLSEDLRVVTIAPVRTWAKGQRYDIRVGLVTDMAGNGGYLSSTDIFSTSFDVVFDASTTAPRLLGISPPDGSSGMPVNTRLMAAFDKAVFLSPDAVRLLDSAGNVVPIVRVYSRDAGLAAFAPVRALAPNSAYRFSVDGVADLSGNPGPGASTSFVTGDEADVTNPLLSLAFPTVVPPNVPLRIRFAEPISPATVNPSQIQLSGDFTVPVDVELAADGRSIVIRPLRPLAAGATYNLTLITAADFAGNTATFRSDANSTRTSFTVGANADTTPPTISFNPADGTTGYPVSALGAPAASFSETVDLGASPPQMRIMKGDTELAGTVSRTSTTISFLPSSPLEYDTTYRIEVSGVVDFAGNAAAPASATFTTSHSATDDRATFKLVSMVPADRSVGVGNMEPIVLTFSKVFAPTPAISVRSSSALPLNGAWTFGGTTATFTPSEPYPSAATLTVSITRNQSGYPLRDLTGLLIDRDYTFTFTTAVRVDPTPLTLVSISPAPGTALPPGNATFTLVFSKPVIVGQGLQALVGTKTVGSNVYYSGSPRTVTATVFSLAGDDVLTLVGTEAIHDEAGAPLTPFAYQYPIQKTDQSGPPSVLSVSPSPGGLTPNTPIRIQFSKPMDAESTLTAIRVTQDGDEITGNKEMLDNNRAAQFTPNVPFRAGSRVDAFVLASATDPNGVPLRQQSQTTYFLPASQTAAAATLSVSATGFGEAVIPAAALDLEFDRDLDPATVAENVWLRTGRLRVAGAAVLRDRRVIRFQPAEPLRPGMPYVLTAGPLLRSTDGLANEPREFGFDVAADAPPSRVESVEYLAEGAPVTVRVRFSRPVSPLSTRGLKLIGPDGGIVRATVQCSLDGREWLVRAAKGLPVRVELEGVEDSAGRALPPVARRPEMAR